MNETKPCILMIDDTPANLRILGTALSEEFDIHIATSGAEGLAIAAQTIPDLILIDVVMPEMDGYECCRRLKADLRLREIPVVFLTALKDNESESRCLAMGAADFISRPINLGITRQRLRNLIDRERLRKTLEFERNNLERLVGQRTNLLTDRLKQLDAIFDLSPDGFVTFDMNRRVIQSNPAFTKLTGLPEAGVVGLDEAAFSDLMAQHCHADARFPGVTALRERLQDTSREDVRETRHLIESAAPGRRVMLVDLRQTDAEGISQILYFRDITHETVVERMKSEFLATAAHELRTPMVSIFGFSELLLEREYSDETRRELLQTINTQSSLVTSIINDLLDLAKIEARRGSDFTMEPVSLREIVSEVVSGCKPPAGRNPPVITAVIDAPIHGSRQKLYQAISNLVSNAYKYSPDGGEVCIRFCKKLVDETLMAGLSVQDQGIGMTAQQKARVFERFYRADSSGKIPGTGLGMSITKEIIEIHGGQIEVESEPGLGTTVTIWLPDQSGIKTPQCEPFNSQGQACLH